MSHTPHLSRLHLEDARHSVIGSGLCNTYTGALYTSCHWVLTRGESDFLLWSKEAGASASGAVSSAHCSSCYPKGVSHTEQKVAAKINANMLQHFFLMEKKCTLLFCVNSALLTQSGGSVSFGAPPPPALTGLSGGRRSHQLIPKAEAPEILGPGWKLIPQVPLCAPSLEMS